jgi:iron(II)-dependent oxidoreductase
VEATLEIRYALELARAGTEAILEPVSDGVLAAKPPAPLPPLVWDFADVAFFEELWLLRNLGNQPRIPDRHEDVYQAFAKRRHSRDGFPTLRPEAVRAYADDVRERVLEALEHTDLEAPNPLLRGRFVFGLVVQHELQAQESLLQTLHALMDTEYHTPRERPPDRAPSGPDEITVPAGVFTLGAVDEPWAYDNELAPHDVELPSYRIDRAPVPNSAFAEFVDDRGYRSRKVWSAEGWEWREHENAVAPLGWEGGKGGWERVRFGRREAVPMNEPVQHVSYWEAEAFAHWAGKRLPTEAEWERAAGWDERRGKMRYPWGQEAMGYEANLGRRHFSPTPVGSYGGGVSPVGCVQMAGDVWEWTTSALEPYPGFLAFPYPELSEIFFGNEYRVLRGGSWATDTLIARTSFRNWQEPGSRHLFSGFRCARDA